MSTYTKTTNFTAKDNLTSGDPAKVIKGSEFDTEFNAIETAVNSKADKNNGSHTGTTTISTANIDTLQIDGVAVTATSAELNTLDGITASTAELNITDGLTASTSELNILDGATLSTAELNLLDGVTATTTELNTLDGITATTTELNYTDGVTSNIQTQLDGKASSTASPTITLGGDLSGSATLTNLGNATLTATVADDSHNHVISNVDGLQTALDGKATTAQGALADSAVQPNDNVTFGTGSFSGDVDVTGTVTADGFSFDYGDTLSLTSGTTGTDLLSTGFVSGQGDYLYVTPAGNSATNNILFRTATGSVYSDRLKIANNGDVHLYEDTGTTAKFVWDSSAESLGIGGAPSAGAKLDVAGETRIYPASGTATLRFGSGGLEKGKISADTSRNVIIESGGSESMRIDSVGNVGIGTASPSRPLSVQSTSTTMLGEFKNPSNTKSFISFANSASSADQVRIGSDSSNLVLSTNYTERMRIDSSGSVGIGTSTPSGLLTLNNASGTAQLYIRSGNSNDSSIIFGAQDDAATGSISYFHSDDSLRLNGYNNTERMRIDSSGNVGIGTSSPDAPLNIKAPQVDLDASDVWGSLHARFDNTSNLNYGGYCGLGFATATADNYGFSLGAVRKVSSGTPSFVIKSHDNDATGSDVLTINSSGNVGIGTASPNYGLTIGGGSNNSLQILSSTTGSGSTNGLRIWNTGGSTAFWNYDNTPVLFGSNNSERIRLDASGNLLVGQTIADSNSAGIGLLNYGRFYTATVNTHTSLFNRKGTDGDILVFQKDGTTVGSIGNQGSDILINAVGTGRLGSGGVAYFKWDSNQFYPAVDNARDLGFSTFRWDDIYATNGTIQTSDINEKQDIEALDEAEQRVALKAKTLLRKFRWKDSVEKKGDDARIHFGIMAQDLQQAFEDEGLDAGRYAMFTSNTWTDEETGEEKTRMGVRYNQLLAFIISAI